MSIQCKPSCTPAPSQWHKHHTNQVKPSYITPATEEDYSMVYPFSEEEYRKGVAILKNNKASGRDDVLVEQLNNLGPKAHRWLTMLNKCFMENKIPTLWRQSKIIAVLKPVKDYAIPKSYWPISLWCHTYKLYERMILNRITPTIEHHLIKEQTGFKPGKSCTSQLFNLTQHIVGSVLGQKIDCTYTHLVRDIIQWHGLSHHSYDDDTQLPNMYHFNHDWRDGLASNELCASEIREWLNQNMFKLNDDKTELIVFTGFV